MEKAKRSAESWTYIPLEDREKEPTQQTRLTLRPLTISERMQVWDQSSWINQNARTGEQTVAPRAFQEAFRLALDCIVSIDGFPASEPAPWPRDRAARIAYLEGFPDMVILEIGNEIIRRMEPEEVVGKS